MKTPALYQVYLALFVSGVLLALTKLNAFALDTNDFPIRDPKFRSIVSQPRPTNTFPIYYFSEKVRGHVTDPTKNEGDYYGVNFKKRVLPETLPAEQDPAGNWGNPAGIFQLSLRFRKQKYERGEVVPAVIILRNLSLSNSPAWLRNARPDNGYILNLHHGTKSIKWLRQQNPLPLKSHGHGGNNDYEQTDPEMTSIIGHVGELTVMELNDFFDVSELGKYVLVAQISVPIPDGKGMTNVVSGQAEFEILEKGSLSK